MITLREPETSVDHREDFYRSERDICSYEMMRDREDRDAELNY